jgi:hypothetical protein
LAITSLGLLCHHPEGCWKAARKFGSIPMDEDPAFGRLCRRGNLDLAGAVRVRWHYDQAAAHDTDCCERRSTRDEPEPELTSTLGFIVCNGHSKLTPEVRRDAVQLGDVEPKTGRQDRNWTL